MKVMRVLAVGLAAAFAFTADSAHAAYPADPLADGNAKFCAPKKPVEDFGLQGLPRVREVPEEAGKQLGHGAVDIYGWWDRVMPEPRAFGYGFSEHNYTGTVKLNWTVRAELWTVDSNGTSFRKVDSQDLFIGRLDAMHQPHIEVDPPKARRGFYRFDMQIETARGETLGRFSAFFKVVRPYWNVQLGLARDVLRPGQRVFSRLENLGSLTASYGEPFSVERFDGMSWDPLPNLPDQDIWLMWGGILGPGKTGLCNSFRLPEDLAAGRYRVVKAVGRSLGKPSRRLTAEFTVE